MPPLASVGFTHAAARPAGPTATRPRLNATFAGIQATGRRSTEPVRSANPAAAGVSLASAASFGRSQAKLRSRLSGAAPVRSAHPDTLARYPPPPWLTSRLSSWSSCFLAPTSAAALARFHAIAGPSRAEFSFLSAGTVEWSPALLVENRHLARTLLLALSGEDARVSNAPIAVMRRDFAPNVCIA